MPDMSGAQRIAAVEVFAPARLHFGFLDLDGGLGRRFGSLGLAIDGFGTRLRLERAARPAASGPGAARALDCVARAAKAFNLSPNVSLAVTEAIPEHAGFGSGTQLALAAAVALTRLEGASAAMSEIAAVAGRGARSGIGIGLFERGGFIVDGGRRPEGGAAPVIARLPFPRDWRLVLLLDPTRQGLYGSGETSAFAALPPFPPGLAGRLCRQVLLRLLPGLAEWDFAAVSQALGAIQSELGDYFSAAQHGRYSSPAVAAALGWAAAQGVAGIGQSSWGPTGFALVESEERARSLAEALGRRFASDGTLSLHIVAGLNRGADISITPRSEP
ncbi:MAG TPA: beta-ribofuranosylaminobenzene 5'-phosphate synthase family protein [Stellaceae bacterium]|nr:beta-ribofuranosylaminobenzene 5'-phosphate synthase family protein [Stellaceae bacterium]